MQKSDSGNSWKKSYQVATSFVQPVLLWAGAMVICRALDRVILPLEVDQIVKQRILEFVRSLSSILAFAYCASSLVEQAQNFFVDTNDPTNTTRMAFQFAGQIAHTATWLGAITLAIELFGFTFQQVLRFGGLGTLLVIIIGRRVFKNFFSSFVIRSTQPFIVNDWVQINDGKVSGRVEHIGWRYVRIRSEDCEVVLIPNDQVTSNGVRNLSRKLHWRIKITLSVSDIHVSQIRKILADMRTVLESNPLVEQEKRVFLDDVNPENQALKILVSCLVKTSKVEEYSCLKEAIILDLLRVISFHTQ